MWLKRVGPRARVSGGARSGLDTDAERPRCRRGSASSRSGRSGVAPDLGSTPAATRTKRTSSGRPGWRIRPLHGELDVADQRSRGIVTDGRRSSHTIRSAASSKRSTSQSGPRPRPATAESMAPGRSPRSICWCGSPYRLPSSRPRVVVARAGPADDDDTVGAAVLGAVVGRHRTRIVGRSRRAETRAIYR